MRRTIVLLLVLACILGGITGVIVAQDEDTIAEDIALLIELGEGVFEPELWHIEQVDWLVGTPSVFWVADSLDAIGFFYVYDARQPATLQDFEFIAGSGWFDAAFQFYRYWSLRDDCVFPDALLFDFKLITGAGAGYRIRYWITPMPDDDERFLVLQLGFPARDEDLLETYSERLLPDAARCP